MVITLTKVMIRQGALEDLLSTADHAQQGIDRAGLLVGELAQDAEGAVARVFDTVELPGVPLRAEPPGLLIALADGLRREAQAAHADKHIVGWFHTHQGSGVSASDEDAQVHVALGNPGQTVALIVDPLNRQASFFRSDGETLIPFAGYYMFDVCNDDCPTASGGTEAAHTDHASGVQVGLPELAEYLRSQPNQEMRPPRRLFADWSARSDIALALRLASVALIVAIIALAAQVWVTHNALKRITAGPAVAIDAGENNAQAQTPTLPETKPADTAPPKAAPSAAQPAPATRAPAESAPTQASATAATPAAPTVKPGAPGTVAVTVMPGESVAVIAKRLYGKATAERIGEILQMNGIENPRAIRTGTVLVFPEPPPGSPGAAAVPGADSNAAPAADADSEQDG